MKNLDHNEHEPFWGEAKDIQALAAELNLCIMVYSKPSYTTFIEKVGHDDMSQKKRIEAAKKKADEYAAWNFFLLFPSMGK